MTPIFYNKRPLTLEKQAELLLDRGLQGISREKLVEILSRVGYYRLRGYTYPYQDNSLNGSPFLNDACWANIRSDYIFDSKLRNLVVEALGYIEIAVRSQLAYHLSIAYGCRWYEDQSICHDKRLFNENDYEDGSA
ncbi:MAG: Abi family protein [Fibrobacter sp.]|nr:Abi family protein [Fibrobacter sp.]